MRTKEFVEGFEKAIAMFRDFIKEKMKECEDAKNSSFGSMIHIQDMADGALQFGKETLEFLADKTDTPEDKT